MSHVLRCSGYPLWKTDMVRAKGCKLYDKSGKEYLDLEGGDWCTVLGHNHPQVNTTICEQLSKLTNTAFRYTAENTEIAAFELLKLHSFNRGKCVFLSSGSEAVEFTIKVARRVNQKPLLLTLSGSYLAAYGSAGSQTSEEWFHFDWKKCQNCPQSTSCDACPLFQSIPGEKIAGFVLEPGSSSGYVRFPPQKLIKAIAKMINELQGLLIVNEVTTGMGKTGRWFGYQHYDLNPDLVAMGKGLGNGYPVSAVAMNEKVFNMQQGSSFRYAQSHQNDPLGCAVANTVIKVMREQSIVEKSKEMGQYFEKQLEVMSEIHDSIGEIRGKGLMLALELMESGWEENICRMLFDKGYIVGSKPKRKVIRFLPPLIIGKSEIDRVLENLYDCLKTLGN